MLNLPMFEVRIEMGDDGPFFSQLFIGKPTVEEVLEVIESRPAGNPHTLSDQSNWAKLLEQHGMPTDWWRGSGRDEEVGFCKHMGVTFATIRVIPKKTLPASATGLVELYSSKYLKQIEDNA